MTKQSNRKTRPSKQSKKLYYFIVEGCTEENYLKLLKQIYKKDAKIYNCKEVIFLNMKKMTVIF